MWPLTNSSLISQAFLQNLHVGHTYECISSLCLGNSWMETVETLYEGRNPLLSILQRLTPGYTHKCTAPPPPSISRNAMKFSTWLGDHKLCITHRVVYLLEKTFNYTQLNTYIHFHSFIAQCDFVVIFPHSSPFPALRA